MKNEQTLDRRQFMNMSLFAALGFATTGCVEEPKPQGEIYTDIPFQYMKIGTDLSFVRFYGEKQIGNDIRYILFDGRLDPAAYNRVNINVKTQQASTRYTTVNPDGFDDGIMRFALPVQATIEKGPCLFEKNGITYKSLASNSDLWAEFDEPIYPNNDPAGIALYRQALSGLVLESNGELARLETGIVRYDAWNQKDLRPDALAFC